MIRGSLLTIEDGTNAATLKCTLASRWNGDAIAATDNIAKGATTGDFTLDAAGDTLTIEATGLTGNAVYAIGVIVSNASGTHILVDIYAAGNDIVLDFQSGPSAGAVDLTTLVDTGTIYIEVLYVTDA